MVELGELEGHHEDFSQRRVQVIVISDDEQSDARATQADFPHLLVVSDAKQRMAKALEVLHPGAGRDGDDTNAPTTFLVDGRGNVRRFLRPDRFTTRPSPRELLSAIDETWPRN